MGEDDWRDANRANWDERVAMHVASPTYDTAALRAGRRRLHPIEEAELGPVEGMRILHLQCHFGMDSLTLAQRGADVVGLDFSPPAIAQAQMLSAELGLSGRSRFVLSDVYDAPMAIAEASAFDIVFSTWGTIGWLPDIERWAAVVAHFLAPGGFLYLADGHPAALVFDDADRRPDGLPGYFVPYFQREAVVTVDPSDYADETAQLENATQHNFQHPMGDVVTALRRNGLQLDFLHEHPAVPWRMFQALVRDAAGMWRWPDKEWLPLSFSLKAVRPR